MWWNQQGNKSLGYVTTPGIKNIIREENLYEIRNHKITVMIWLQLALNFWSMLKTMSPYLWEGTPLQRPISWCCLFSLVE